MGNPLCVLPSDPAEAEPLRPAGVDAGMPSHHAAARRRAMQAALANAVRAMRSSRAGRRSAERGSGGTTRGGGA
jgi:hypothetical protein